MNCFAHRYNAAVGMCAICQKGVCRDCVGTDTPRLVCRTCTARGGLLDYGVGRPFRGAFGWYGYGYEYRSSTTIAGWPLIHICAGVDPLTLRLRVARGIVAIGNVAVGVLAIGGLACGLFTVGGASIGLLLAVGGAAVGLGLSIGGFAVGSIAIGGAAVGFVYAIGGGAFGPAVIDGRHCDEAARAFARRWFNVPMPSCR